MKNKQNARKPIINKVLLPEIIKKYSVINKIISKSQITENSNAPVNKNYKRGSIHSGNDHFLITRIIKFLEKSKKLKMVIKYHNDRWNRNKSLRVIKFLRK